MIEDTGLPTIKPFFCFGSSPIFLNKIYFHLWCHEKHRQLGRTFTKYFGITPVISTIDPDLIREICVTQFHNFIDCWTVDINPEDTTLTFARFDIHLSLSKIRLLILAHRCCLIFIQGGQFRSEVF